jgi:tRNA (guanine-N7-)-methyltransferase
MDVLGNRGSKVDYGIILFPRELTLPLDLGQFSEGRPKAELEIGFGNGEFTIERAIAHSDTLLIGMEVSTSCVVRCARRAQKLETGARGNLKIICTDARFMMKELFVDASLNRVIMNFPCPWPKTCHAKRRVTAKEFSDDLAAVLKIGGVFEMLTDDERYASEVELKLGQHEALSLVDRETNPPRFATTKYERKWLEMGKNITRLIVAKTKPFSVGRRTWSADTENDNCKEEDGAVHIKTGNSLPKEGLAFLFGVSGERDGARWVFKKYYAEKGEERGGSFLVETISADDEFEQRYYLKVVERNHDTLVKLDGTAKVFLTPAVRLAVADLGRRLGEASKA